MILLLTLKQAIYGGVGVTAILVLALIILSFSLRGEDNNMPEKP